MKFLVQECLPYLLVCAILILAYSEDHVFSLKSICVIHVL